jgi:hypothetical protein
MAQCVYCGEDTKLFEKGSPICVTCSDLTAAERKKRKEAKTRHDSGEQGETNE